MNDLERLKVIEEIRRLKARYCRCADTKDYDAYEQLFTDDAVFEMREWPYARNPATNEKMPPGRFDLEFAEKLARLNEWPIVGRKQIAAAARAGTTLPTTIHHVFAPEISVASDTEASAIWPMEDFHFNPPDWPFRKMRGLGHYYEGYVKLGESWLIKSLTLKRLWVEME